MCGQQAACAVHLAFELLIKEGGRGTSSPFVGIGNAVLLLPLPYHIRLTLGIGNSGPGLREELCLGNR